ncbi:Diaminopropionate ammonia-lyase [bioreactor metagenome]|uniref:Diaminopropionate ammonia-lyase n=1 Tax=bioreactor metagenome TaxID=1076179 RepID=A0A644TUB0_9ZZZZ
MPDIKWITNNSLTKPSHQNEFSFAKVNSVQQFHAGFPGYAPTPLVSLTSMAQSLGLGGLYVKDESYRFGLNAFKALGGSYAIGRYLADRLGIDIAEATFEVLTSPATKKKLGEMTFVTATDGNHGRGVAWAAAKLGHKSVVYMPKGSSPERLKNIQREGAEASITALNYDDAVRLAADNAQKHGWIVVQDTAWPGYQEIPLWIMQGYTTMAMEAYQELAAQKVKPTHIFLQAGVGSFAAAIQAFVLNAYPDAPPKVVIVEPHAANCIFRSAEAGDGKPRFVSGDMNTIMAGLACGEPSTIAWGILAAASDMFISCPDWVAARGMRVLGNPLGTDSRIIAGESGAVTAGIVSLLMTCSDLSQAREELKLNSSAQVLVINTEGDTDPDNYRSIVWDGAYSSPV